MVRWQPESRARLETAAMTLFAERGFENTTVAEIAERAGLTERTFFRYFTDKREVLFGGAGHLKEVLVGAADAAPIALAPMDVVSFSLQAVGELFVDRYEFARQRQLIVLANDELRERELVKLAACASALAEALGRRGVSPSVANLAAEAGIAVFKVAFGEWTAESGERGLAELMTSTFTEMRDLSSAT